MQGISNHFAFRRTFTDLSCVVEGRLNAIVVGHATHVDNAQQGLPVCIKDLGGLAHVA